MKKTLPVLIVVLVILFGAYYFTSRNRNPQEAGGQLPAGTLDGEKYSLTVPEGWSSGAEKAGPLDGPFRDVIVLQSPDFVRDEGSEYGMATSGAEIKIWFPIPDKPEISSLSEFSDPYARGDVLNTTVAGEPAITYVWAYEGPILLYTVFVHEKRLYIITLQAAEVEGLESVSKFDLYRAEYETVLGSFKFKT